jgi:HEAT repeat protein
MIAPSEFQRYLQSILDDSREDIQREVRDRYIPTLAELPLQVQTCASSKADSQEQQKERREQFAVLEGLRKYASEHVLLVGKPGSGKSTSLRRLLWEEAGRCLEAIEHNLKNLPLIPVLVELRECRDGSVLGLIQKRLQRQRLRLKLEEIEDLLFEGCFLLLLDGLNELPNQDAWHAVNDFRQNYPDVPMVFTTRELGSGSGLGIAKKMEMLPLTEPQMREFVHKRLPETGGELWRQIQGKLRELAETPLLLKLLCDVFEQNNEGIPKNRGDLFRKEFKRRYEEFKPERLRNVSEDSRRFAFDLLSYLAFTMVQGEPHTDPCKPSASWITISRTHAEKILATSLAGDRTTKFENTKNAKEWLEDLLEWHLLQVASDRDRIEFHHQLFQEYYAAERLLPKLVELSDEELKYDYLNYLKWTEPLAMAMTFVDSPDLVVRVVKLALEVDLYLGARLAGEVKPEFQKRTIDLVISECEQRKLPPLIKVTCLHLSRSVYSVQTLIEALNEPNSDTQEKALQALEEIADATVLPNLLQVIENPDGRKYPLVMDVIDLLVSLDSKNTTIPKLLDLLKSQYPGIREIAVLALGRFNTKEYIPELVQALNDPTIRVRKAVVRSLGEIGYQEIIPDLLKMLDRRGEEYDKRMFSTAAFALAKLDFEQALSHPDAEVRGAAIYLLEKRNPEIALPRLKAALKDTNFYVRGQAIVVVGQLKAKEFVEDIFQALEAPEIIVQSQAASALGKICSVEIIPELLKKLNTQESRTRRAIVDAMRNLDSEQAVPGLFQALVDSEQSVRRNALYALGQLCRKTAIPYFIEILLDPKNEYYNILLNNYLQELEPRRKSELLEQTNYQDIHIRWEAVKTLARVASHAAIPDLIKDFSKAKNVGHRWRLIDSLKSTANEQILPTLLDALNDQEVAIRRYAAFAIRDIGSCLHLPDLWQQQSRNPLEAIGTTIAAIQSRCQFYNYEIYQQAQAKEKPKFTDAAYLAPPTHITQNFYGSVYGVAGNVEGHQNIRSHNNSQHEYSKQEEYERILSTLHHMALVMERNPETFCAIGEEALRDHFLVQLNGTYEGQATGETSNGRGKTDIIVRLQGENIFIGECKFWGGEAKLQETLDQLLGYTTLRDNQLGMLIFNRNKGFSAVLEKIPAIIRSHPSFFRETNHSETQFRFVLKHPDDSECKLNLAVLVFNIPSNSR